MNELELEGLIVELEGEIGEEFFSIGGFLLWADFSVAIAVDRAESGIGHFHAGCEVELEAHFAGGDLDERRLQELIEPVGLGGDREGGKRDGQMQCSNQAGHDGII